MINFLNKPELIFFNTVEWFHLFLSNTNAQLNDQTVLLQFRFLLTHSDLFKYIFLFMHN